MTKAGPTRRAYSMGEAAWMLAYLSREAGPRRTEPGSVNVNPQRRKQLLARAKQTAAEIRARP